MTTNIVVNCNLVFSRFELWNNVIRAISGKCSKNVVFLKLCRRQFASQKLLASFLVCPKYLAIQIFAPKVYLELPIFLALELSNSTYALSSSIQ